MYQYVWSPINCRDSIQYFGFGIVMYSFDANKYELQCNFTPFQNNDPSLSLYTPLVLIIIPFFHPMCTRMFSNSPQPFLSIILSHMTSYFQRPYIRNLNINSNAPIVPNAGLLTFEYFSNIFTLEAINLIKMRDKSLTYSSKFLTQLTAKWDIK